MSLPTTTDEPQPVPIEAVIFDLGGVLIDWNRDHLYRQLIADDAERSHFLREICSPEWNSRADAGEPFADLIAEQVRAHPERRELIEAYWLRWPEMCPGPFPETVEILETVINRGFEVYALTNWSAETLPRVEDRFPFLDWFDGIVVSGHEGVIKPDPEIFDRLSSRFGITPEAAVFIDDSPFNVEGAAALGYVSIHYISPTQLRAELAALGVLA